MSPADGRVDVHERLRRLLFLVPFVSRNQGLTVEALATALGVTRDALLEELDLLTLVGRPPFQPDDFVDIYVEDDRVFVELDQRLSAPPRLTAAEGVALASAAALLKPASGDALRLAIEKLERVLPAGAVERFRELGKRLDVTLEAPDGLATLSQALVEHREVAFDYAAVGSGTTERRQVQPHALFSHRGQWYLSAFDVGRQGDRLFRLDRVAALVASTVTFSPPADGQARAAPGSSATTHQVTVRVSAPSAASIRERFGGDARALPDGGVEIEVPGDSERWLTSWVLSFGGDAVVVSPDWAIRSVAKAAAAALEAIRPGR